MLPLGNSPLTDDKMSKLAFRLSAALLPLLALAAAPAPQRVTPMTPDVVESYNPVLPQADFIKREEALGAVVVNDMSLPVAVPLSVITTRR